MDWPAYSPDLNPIQHVWDMFADELQPINLLPHAYQNFRGHCFMSGVLGPVIPKDAIYTNASSERLRLTSHRDDCRIARNKCIQPTTSLAAIQAQVAPSLGAPVSSRTIRKRLAAGHLGSRRPLRALPLKPTHRRLRLEWCHARGNWTAMEWNQLVFSDESRFNLSSDDNRVRVRRPRGERINPAFATQLYTAPSAAPMNHFLTRKGSTSHGKGVTRLSPHCCNPPLAILISKLVSNRAYLGSFGMASWASYEFQRTSLPQCPNRPLERYYFLDTFIGTTFLFETDAPVGSELYEFKWQRVTILPSGGPNSLKTSLEKFPLFSPGKKRNLMSVRICSGVGMGERNVLSPHTATEGHVSKRRSSSAPNGSHRIDSTRQLATRWSTATDEEHFTLRDRDGCIRVRRFAGERCLPDCVIERYSGLIPRVMVWGAISYQEQSNLL
ncbi:transposable element Tcb1 transposase [Trichonephila clavipes]|nr:transposable element Tcb1 transposase [Trichonephila clavipes]